MGGWTIWHIRQYLERNLEKLAPDVLTLYVGHNDLLTPVPAPYSQLYAAWQRPSAARRLTDTLGQSALFQGFRYLLVSFRPPGERVAVPLDEAEQNLRATADMDSIVSVVDPAWMIATSRPPVTRWSPRRWSRPCAPPV